MVNTIDELMDKDPLNLSAKDIDDIIEYERKQRGIFEKGGGKAKKADGEKQDLDIAGLLTSLKASGLNPVVIDDTPKPKIGRRF